MRYVSFLLFLTFSISSSFSQWSSDPSENTRVTNGGLLPQIISDGTGGAYIVYQDSPALLRQVWVQWLDKYGYVRFPDNGIRISSADRYQTPYYFLVSDSAGGVIVVFDDLHLEGDETTGETSFAVYAQRIDSTSTKLWGDAGLEISPLAARKSTISACSDGAHGAFVFWGEDADNNGAFELRTQRITADGQFAWPDTGVVVTDKFIFDNISNPNPAVSDGAGNAIILYSDSSSTKLQKLNADGAFLWDEGISIFPLGRQMIADNFGGAIVAGVRREFDGVSVKYIIRANRIDVEGKMLWREQGVAVDSLADKTNPGITFNKIFEIVFVWQKNINDTFDVFLNKISEAGNLIFPEGIEVSGFKSRKVAPEAVSNLSNSEIIIWYDYRHGNEGLFSPDALFAQRIDGNGSRLWGESDIEVSISEVQHRSFQVISDMAGGAIVCWYEIGTGSGWGIFAQQISRNGKPGEVLVTSVSQPDKSSVPTQYALHQSYPNPFNSEMIIKYELPERNSVTLIIYDITGKGVITLINENKSPGTHQVKWNGKNMKGGDAASGIYVYQLRVGSFVENKKSIFIK